MVLFNEIIDLKHAIQSESWQCRLIELRKFILIPYFVLSLEVWYIVYDSKAIYYDYHIQALVLNI